MATALASAAIATNRFGLGARPDELSTVGSSARTWLSEQLRGGPALVDAAGLQSSQHILSKVLEMRRDRRTAEPEAAQAIKLNQLYRPIYLAECAARLRQAVTTRRSFAERLVHFWANHFAISADKRSVSGIVGAFEREAIRPHVLGSFRTMLLAVEQHPAMLLYLDNHLSMGPGSTVARRSAARTLRQRDAEGRARGLNENLAREILELHTLGVDGGYTQTDVTRFAKVMTGWSVGGDFRGRSEGHSGEFAFRAAWHEPGAQEVLGKRYAEDGVQQGEAVLRDLARHPATARHIATKLARHFVADEPPPAVVNRLARVYRDSDGDLPTLYRTLIDCEECWRTELVKFKTPNEYIVSTYRALELPVEESVRTFAQFDLLGQRPWTPGSPAGWPDRAGDWDGAAAIFKRVEWADAVASRLGAKRAASALAPQVLGATLTEATRTAIARADSGTQAMTLLLVAPEFMRR